MRIVEGVVADAHVDRWRSAARLSSLRSRAPKLATICDTRIVVNGVADEIGRRRFLAQHVEVALQLRLHDRQQRRVGRLRARGGPGNECPGSGLPAQGQGSSITARDQASGGVWLRILHASSGSYVVQSAVCGDECYRTGGRIWYLAESSMAFAVDAAAATARLRPKKARPYEGYRVSTLSNSAGAVMCGLWLASISAYGHPSRRARSADGPNASPGPERVQ